MALPTITSISKHTKYRKNFDILPAFLSLLYNILRKNIYVLQVKKSPGFLILIEFRQNCVKLVRADGRGIAGWG